MTTRAQRPTTQAFTLIEVLVAIAVFAIVLAAVNTIFWGALELRRKTVESIDAAIPNEQALAIIRSDLLNIVAPGTNLFLTALDTSSINTNKISGSMPSQAQQGMSSPVFTTSNGQIDDNSYFGDVQKVTYYLAASTNGSAGKDLIRSVTRNLLPVTQVDNETRSILGGVQSIFFSYHNGSQWKDTWDTNETLRLPRAVKAQIVLASLERGRLAPPPLEVIANLIDAGTNTLAQATSTTAAAQ
jgi:type II secretion system protein J